MQSPFLLLFKLSVTQVWRKSKQNCECESAATEFYKMAAMTSTIYANDLKLKSDHLDVCRTNCAKFHSNRSSSFVTWVVTDRQTDRPTDRQTHAHTHTRLRFLPRDNHNTFSPLKKTECKKRERPAAFRDFIRKYYFQGLGLRKS